jgi:hypothetical protein
MARRNTRNIRPSRVTGLGKFLRGLFSEDNGVPSFSRIASGLIILSVLVWVTFIVIRDWKMPDLSGAAMFLSGSIGALYSVNKVATAIGGKDKDE